VTRTLFGRERPIPEINGRKRERARLCGTHGGEFAATGHGGGPHQAGHGAHRRGAGGGWASGGDAAPGARRIGLECPPEELDAVSGMVKREMEGVYQLAAPLVVDIGTGDNWRAAK
jgi:hypothetical protein